MLNSNRPYWAALLLLLCLMANVAHAVSIQSTRSQYEPGGVRYYFTVTAWEGAVIVFATILELLHAV